MAVRGASAWILLALCAGLFAGGPSAASTEAQGSCDEPPLTGITFTLAPQGHVVMDPTCVHISSGQRITWTNLDTRPHNPASFNDGRRCFQSYHVGHFLQPGEQHSVSLSWDGEALHASSFDRFGMPVADRDCDPTIIETLPTLPGVAMVRFFDSTAPDVNSLKGEIRISPE